MTYVEHRAIHDADSHVMELPEKITEFIETKYFDEFSPFVRHRYEGWVEGGRSPLKRFEEALLQGKFH